MGRKATRTLEPSVEQSRLRYNVLFETLTDEEFDQMKGSLKERRLRPGEVIIEDESHGEEMFFLVQGRVRIGKVTQTGEEQLLAILHPGDCFGELELIAGRPRSARVVAMEPVIVYTLHRDEFESLLATSHAFSYRLLQVLSVRVRAMNYHFIRESNRRLERAQRELRKVAQLIEAAKKLNSTLNLEEVLDIILEMTLRVVDADRGTVFLVDEERSELWTKVAKGLDATGRTIVRLPVGKGIAGYVAATGDTINIPDAYLDPRFSPEFDRQTGYRTESILCMPMRNKDSKIIGVFQLLNKRSGLFTDEDATFVDALSVHAALAIENARLYEQERQKMRIERDLHAAREVQMSLLPKQVPRVTGYEFAASTVPALEVAGDLYDFLSLDGGRLAISLGDVSGKGLAASLLMANIQATLRDQAKAMPSAVECIRRTNNLMFQNTSPEKFVTLFYSVLDCKKHALKYCSAGHEPAILLSGTSEVRHLSTGGILLGIMSDFPFEEKTLTLNVGDVLVIYSDGISEAPNVHREQFGLERLEEVVRKHREGSAVQIQEAIHTAVQAHLGELQAADDMTLVIIKRLSQA
jgi:serine phosphatase RsbU (regulator of sigma subunit)/CRP-like cAMP-binding protein